MTNDRTWKNVGVLVAGTFAVAIGACSADTVKTVDPHAVWSYVPNDDVAVLEKDTKFGIDFGIVALGARSTQVIAVKNEGGVPLTIPPIGNLANGFTTDIPPTGLTVNVAQIGTIEVSFAPTEETTYAFSGLLAVSDYGDQSLSIELSGQGQLPQFSCDTNRLDFGNVLKSLTSKRTFSCRNDSQVDGVLIVQAIEGNNKALFSHTITGNNGRVAIEAGKSLEISVTFRADGNPGTVGADLEILHEENDNLRSRVARVRLEGRILAHAISCEPNSTLDLGFVAPGNEKHAKITCSNNASEPFEITSIELAPASYDGFTWEPTNAPITIPPFEDGVPGLLEIDVAFKPTADDLGTRKNGVLVIASSDSTNPRVEITLTGFAGGPVISCSPADIDFGVVPTALSSTRTFVCFNDGTSDPDPNRVDDALLVTSVESSKPTEFTVAVRDGLKPGGYQADTNDSFIVDVVYKPVDDGPDGAAITIVSNDTVHSQEDPFAVEVRGLGRDLPPCDFDIVPPDIRFGIVDRGSSATLEFAVRNNSMDSECLIQNVRLSDTCDLDAFSLPSGGVKTETLPPEGEGRFQIRFSPKDYQSTPFTCEILFDISHPDQPNQAVPVRGVSQKPCALIAPNDHDFGTVTQGCATRDREFQIINACSTPLVFRSIELNASASQDEFFIRAEPTEGTKIAPGLSTTFKVAYRPVDLTEDLGSVFVYVNEDTEPYMASFRGQGSTEAVQYDTFKQNDKPKVDILWVIDNSGSMSEEQNAIANNLDSFIAFAESNKIDYQIGVTTTGLTPSSSGCPGGANGGEDGRLFPIDGSQPRILTSSTPNLKTAWSSNFRVGTCHGTEKGMEAAYRALSYPLITETKSSKHNSPYDDGNLGFLRRDAHLSIIEVTDEPDASDQTATFYLNAFLAIKGFRNSHLLNYHAITGPKTTGCPGASPGDKLIELVEQTDGGVVQSICEPDWAVSLGKMSQKAFGSKSCFKLTSDPKDTNGDNDILDTDGEITVMLQGRPVSSTSGQQTIWYYSREQNAICFNPLAVPEPDAQIEANYSVACLGL